ncbi:MAG: YezD family protein [Gammaproteobacteria bacterium]
MATETPGNPTTKQSAAEIAGVIIRMLEGVRFGSIEITVHDGKVVQIERKEKIRPDFSKSRAS